MVIMDYLEWPMLSYYVIYYEKLKKRHAANREGSFNNMTCIVIMTLDSVKVLIDIMN